MPIDFHAAANRRSYTGRQVDESWTAAITGLVEPAGAAVVDVGCGGGTCTRAWHDLGAATVTGVDFSEPMLEAARESSGDLPGVSFRLGDAAATGLPDRCADVVFERALVHHVSDFAAVAAEAARILRPGGVALVQDRTPDDVAQPGSPEHPRGWLFEVFPHLLEVENARRRYADRAEYLDEIAQRTGRSILHDLDDAELGHLVAELRRLLPEGPLVERDRWTLWRGERPAG